MCQVQIISVNGIDPSGGINPTQLRVAGRISQCPSGQVVVRVNSPFVAASLATSPTFFDSIGDGFIVVIPIPAAANLSCGDPNNPIDVQAECSTRPACKDTFVGPLECCEIAILTFHAEVPPRWLTPSRVLVTGTSEGCTSGPQFQNNDPVVVQITFASGATAQSTSVPNALTGAFSVAISIPSGTTVQCDDPISLIEAWCSTRPTTCRAQPIRGRPLHCPQCARATPTVVSAGQCTGMPPKQAITPGATINIAKGSTRFFKWNYGDGSIAAPNYSPVFEIDNTNGLATTAHTVPPYALNPGFPLSHDYSPSTYNAELVVTDAQGKLLECDKIPLTVTASCDQCPDVTVSYTLGQCVNGMMRVTLNANVTSLPAGVTIFHWEHRPTQFGGTQQVASTGSWPPVPTPNVNQFDYAPGTYTANLVTVFPPGCPQKPVMFTVACPPACCPTVTIDKPQTVNSQMQPEVMGCAPTSVVATFSAQVGWAIGCTPVAPTAFIWTLDGPTGKKYHKETPFPNTDTTTGWEDPPGSPTVVQFPTKGNYSIAVVAIVPGIPTSCLIASASFYVSACCPQLIAPLIASEKMGDRCTWIFSAGVSNPSNATVTFEWSFQDGATATTPLPHTDHTYLPNAPMAGVTTLTLKSPNCPDQKLDVPVPLVCVCPTIANPSAAVSGCLPGTPSVSLTTSVATAGAASSFEWSVTTPGNARLTKTTTVGSTSDGTADGAWTDTSTGATGPIDLTVAGGYVVTVKAIGAGISPTCQQPTPSTFSIGPCPTSALSCTWWCVILSMLFLTIPISAYISTAAYCLPPLALAGFAFGIAVALGILIPLCGICCIWLFILIGSFLGIVATLIYSYWGGFPACWLAGLLLLIGFVTLGLGLMIYCFTRASSSGSSGSGSSTGSSSSGLSSAGRASEMQRLYSRRPGHVFGAAGTTRQVVFSSSAVVRADQPIPVSAPMPFHGSAPRVGGLGDLIQHATRAVGIPPCAACRQRAERLNQLVPFEKAESHE